MSRVARPLAAMVVLSSGSLVTGSPRKLEAEMADPISVRSVAATASAAAPSATKIRKETRTLLPLSRRCAPVGGGARAKAAMGSDGSRPDAKAEAEADAEADVEADAEAEAEATAPSRRHAGEASATSRRRRELVLVVVLRKVAMTCAVVTPTSAATSSRIFCLVPGKMLESSAETVTLYSTVDLAFLITSLGAPKENAAAPVGMPASASIAFCTSLVWAAK